MRSVDSSLTTAISICEVGAVGATKPERVGIVRLKSEIKQVRAGGAVFSCQVLWVTSSYRTGRIDGRAGRSSLLGFRELTAASRSSFWLQSCPGGRIGVNLLVGAGVALAVQYGGSTGVLEKVQGWGGPRSVPCVAGVLVGLFQQQKLHFLLLLQQLDKRRQSLTGSKVKPPWSSCSLSFYPSRHTPGQLPSMHELMSFPKQTR